MKTAISERLHITEGNPIKARYYDYDHFRYPWHFHSQYEINYVKESFGLSYMGDRIERFESGDVLMFGSNLPHYVRSDESYMEGVAEGRVRGTIVQFEAGFMSYSIHNYPQLISIREFLAQSRRGFIFPAVGDTDIVRLLEEFPLHNGFRQLIDLLELLERLSVCPGKRLVASPSYHKEFSIFDDDRTQKILAYINSNYTDPRLGLEDVASKAAMNTSAFCRYFKQQVGKSFVTYVSEMRVAHACKLLTLKRPGISHIAAECGFGSIGNFNRTFKQITSFTPTQYQARATLY